MRVLHNICLKLAVRYLPCLYKNCNHPFIFFRSLSDISSHERVLSNKHPKYSTEEYCFNVTSSLFILTSPTLLLRFFGLKIMHLVLSSPKCIESLLSTNQSHRVLKFVFSIFSITLISLCL
jgi:hypothetical protein